MRVAVGSDHAGFDLKEILKAELAALGHEVEDHGTDVPGRAVDYPDFGALVGRAVAGGAADLGVCVCGTGNGIAMAANKIAGVRAAVVHDVTTATLARRHNHANVVCVGARTTGATVAVDALAAFLGGVRGARTPRPASREAGGPRPGARPPDSSRRDSMSSYETALAADPEVADLIGQELDRQQTTLQLIASENFTSAGRVGRLWLGADQQVQRGLSGPALLRRQPHHRRGRGPGSRPRHGALRRRARQRAAACRGQRQSRRLPGAGRAGGHDPGHAARPRRATSRTGRPPPSSRSSGASSPTASHRSRTTSPIPGEVIDFDQVAHLAKTEKPALIVAGSTAYARVIDPRPFREIADSVGALFMFDAAHPAGLIAGGVHPSPVGCRRRRHPHHAQDACAARAAAPSCAATTWPRRSTARCSRACRADRSSTSSRPRRSPSPRRPGRSSASYAAQVVANAAALADALSGHGFRLVSGGTDNHMLLVDLRPFDAELTGKEAQEVLDRAGITCNRNTIPDDPRSPFLTSGLRLGTAAETTAGMGTAEMQIVADLIVRTLKARTDEDEIAAVRSEVAHPVRRLPAVSRPRGLARARHRLVRPGPGDRRGRHGRADDPSPALRGPSGLRRSPGRAHRAHQADPLRRRCRHVHGVPGRRAGSVRRAPAAAHLPGLARR